MKTAKLWSYPICGYPDVPTMIRKEKARGENGIDMVVILTPNNCHADQAMRFLQAGIPVFCEKPLTTDLTSAKALARTVKKTGVPFGVAHTYIGHWTSFLARHIIGKGLIGQVRRVVSTYDQGWLHEALEKTGQRQAKWRTNPKQAGKSGCGGDIATHALMQMRFMTGLEVDKILHADMRVFVKGRKLDDNFHTFCKLSNGGIAQISATQIAIGHKNDLNTEINGTTGTIRWKQEDSEKLTVYSVKHGAELTYWRGAVPERDPFLGDVPKWLLQMSTLPSGHGEAFHDAFRRLYEGFELDVRRWKTGEDKMGNDAGTTYAGIDDGIAHMRFIDMAVRAGGKLKHTRLK